METEIEIASVARGPLRARLSAWPIVLAAGLWGTVGVVTRLLYNLSVTNAASVGFWRLAFSVPAVALLTWRVLGASALRIARRDLGLMVVIGAMMAVYQVCYFAAIPYLGVTVAVIITICSAPIIVAVLAACFLKERFTARVAMALISALAGTALLAGLNLTDLLSRGRELTGLLFALGSGAGYAVLALCSRSLAGRYHPLQPIAIGFAVGALLLLPAALAAGLTVTYPAPGWGLLLYLGVVPSALGYWLYLNGMKTTSATTASILTLLEPLTSTVLAAVLFGEHLGPLGLAGAALLIGAMALLLTQPANA